MNCLFLLLPGKLHFLPYILLCSRGMFLSFCSCKIHLCLLYCCLLVFCFGSLLLLQCLSCSCSLISYCFCLDIFLNLLFLSKIFAYYFKKLFIYVCFNRFEIWGIEPYNFSFSIYFLFLHSSI